MISADCAVIHDDIWEKVLSVESPQPISVDTNVNIPHAHNATAFHYYPTEQPKD